MLGFKLLISLRNLANFEIKWSRSELLWLGEL